MKRRAIVSTVGKSESLAALTDFEERLFWRLVSQTDDFGACYATPAKVRALCVPLLDVTNAEVASALDSIVREGHAEIYIVDGRAYIRFLRFDEYQPWEFIRYRNLRNGDRFPPPTEASEDSRNSTRFAGVLREPPSREDGRSFKGSVNSAAVARPHGELPLSHSPNGKLDLGVVAASLKDADARTPAVLATFRRRGLPEGAFHRALEALAERKTRADRPPLESEVRYVVSALKRMEEEGQYASA